MVRSTLEKAIIAVALIIGVLSIAGIIALTVVWHKKLTPFQDYALVVDAGSTHSKIYLYTWPSDKSDGLGSTSRVNQVIKPVNVEVAITTITDPTETNVQQYFNSAMTKCINEIPSTRKGRALIFLGGTAGLRLFEMNNASYTDSLLSSTRAYFSTLGLLFKEPENQVRIINGSEEGLSGWTSTNMLMHKLDQSREPFDTYAVSDMGGASTQISFVDPNATNDRFAMNLFATDYSIYSHSYLCYGAEKLRFRYLGEILKKANGSLSINDSCLQSGYIEHRTYDEIFGTGCARDQYAPPRDLDPSSNFTFIGSGDYSACVAAVQERLNKTLCTSTNCSFDNVYQPKISPSLKIIAISAWYSTFNNLAPNVTLKKNDAGNYDFDTVNLTQIKTAIAAICSQPWGEIPDPDAYRPLLCFNSMYHWTLFEYGYSMTDANLKNFHIMKTIDTNEVGWTLGYMINQTNALAAESRPGRLLTQAEFGGLLFLCLFLLIASIIITIISIYHYKHRREYTK